MSLVQSLWLGLVQGLTEFLPVSSSGHLALVQAIMKIKPDLAFDVLLHLGTLVAVLIAYWSEVLRLLRAAASLVWPAAWPAGAQPDRQRSLRLLAAIVVGTIPAGLAGVFLENQVAALFHDLGLVALFFWVTALLLIVADWKSRHADRSRQSKTESAAEPRGERGAESRRAPNMGQALLVGLGQALALPPGISRSGTTVVAALLAGLPRQEAADFSFLLSIPVIAGAGVLSLPDLLHGASGASAATWGVYLAGFAVAALAGYVAIRLFLALIREARLSLFSLYLFALGAVVLLARWRGWLG